jgi:O-acetyl-ADP-ribose deacetylase (regulator of RNase III)
LKFDPEKADMSAKDEVRAKFLENRVQVVIGDITRQHIDAIVNAANSTLLGGGGVDGAIHSAGGGAILEECREIRRSKYPDGLPTGRAVITTGGNLPAHYVIHTVGPIYGREGGRDAELLAACYSNSLALCCEHELTSVAFPAISTGAFGYPATEAAAVSSMTIKNFLSTDRTIDLVRLVFFHPGDALTFINNQCF